MPPREADTNPEPHLRVDGHETRGAAPRGPRVSLDLDWWALLVLPAIVFLAIFFAFPVVDFLAKSFTNFVYPERGGLDNFRWFTSQSINVTILRRTVVTAFLITAVCALVGYPYAYLATITRGRIRLVLLGAAVVSFLSSLLVRSFAWLLLVEQNGPINDGLAAVGIRRIDLSGTTTAVVIALSQILVPLMILPVYANLRAVDRRLLLAARSLGARPSVAFFRVILPLSAPGVLAGSFMVFVLTLGFYVTPTLVGSPQNALLSQIVITQISELLAFGRAGAISIILVVLVVAMAIVVATLSRRWLKDTADQSGPAGSASADMSTLGRVLWSLFGVIGVGWLIVPSLAVVPISLAARPSFAFPPSGWSLHWYANLFTNSEWLDAIRNTIEIGLLTTLFCTIIGTMAALGLVRSRMFGLRLVNVLLLAPTVVPLVVIGVAIYSVFLDWRLVGTTQGFVAAHSVLALPFVIVTVASALQTFDRRLEDAAASLGAGPFDRFISVTLPGIRAGLLSAAFLAFVLSFDETAFSLFIATPNLTTLPIEIYQGITRTIDPTVAAASTITFAVTATGVALAGLATTRQLKRGSAD